MLILGIALLFPLALLAEEATVLHEAVKGFGSADPAAREAASRQAQDEVRKLLAPLLEALNDRDPEVRRRARAALQMELPQPVMREVPNWHPMKAAGPPDAVANQDHPNAWASRTGNMGQQWLKLGYRKGMRVNRIRIYEVNRAGAVSRVATVDDKGKVRVVWKGADPTRAPGVFDLKIKQTPYKVVGIVITFDTNRVSGWNEIDAVEIVGPDGRDWAVTATASSSYATR